MRWLAGLVVVVVVGCSKPEPPVRRYEPAAAVKPTSKEFAFPGGTLTVLEVPIQAGRVVEMQRCFVWRSERAESVSCSQDTDPGPIRLPDDPAGAAERH
jgi:hypothetical protein